VKTGRLLKFHRPAAEIHVYLYQDGAAFKATVYVRATATQAERPPLELQARTAAALDAEVRAWVDAHYPR